MSWQATAWAVRQKVGPPARKLLLLVVANYADSQGVCWPSQKTLSEDTGMSLDTVQRQIKKLKDDGFISIARPPKRRGQWQTFIYQLDMSEQETKPQNAARSAAAAGSSGYPPRGGGLAGESGGKCGPAGPHPAREPGRTAMRLKPSIEPSIEPSRAKPSSSAAERLLAFQGKRELIEVTQNRLARRLGGWGLLQKMDDRELERITKLEQRGQLDDETLHQAALRARLAPESNTKSPAEP
jgi:hypothetical protein